MKQTLLLILGIILILFTICWLASLRNAGKFDDEAAKCYTVTDETTGYGHKHACYDMGYMTKDEDTDIGKASSSSKEIVFNK